MNKIVKHVLFSIVAVLPLLYLLVIWDSIPQIVPLRFSTHGHFTPTKFGTKFQLLSYCAIISAISLLVYFLLQYIQYIDPKRKGQSVSKTFDKLSVVSVVFIAALNILTIVAATKNAEILKYLYMPLIGLLFTFLGNFMYSIKPNYFAGIRTPWTLNDDDNWRKTHQLGGVLFFTWGIVFTLLSLLLPLKVAGHVLKYSAITLVLIVYAYSFVLFKRADKKTEN